MPLPPSHALTLRLSERPDMDVLVEGTLFYRRKEDSRQRHFIFYPDRLEYFRSKQDQLDGRAPRGRVEAVDIEEVTMDSEGFEISLEGAGFTFFVEAQGEVLERWEEAFRSVLGARFARKSAAPAAEIVTQAPLDRGRSRALLGPGMRKLGELTVVSPDLALVQRFFIMYEDHLLYWRSEASYVEGDPPRGGLPMSDVRRVERAKCGFLVFRVGGGTPFELRAATEEDAGDWMRSWRLVCGVEDEEVEDLDVAELFGRGSPNAELADKSDSGASGSSDVDVDMEAFHEHEPDWTHHVRDAPASWQRKRAKTSRRFKLYSEKLVCKMCGLGGDVPFFESRVARFKGWRLCEACYARFVVTPSSASDVACSGLLGVAQDPRDSMFVLGSDALSRYASPEDLLAERPPVSVAALSAVVACEVARDNTIRLRMVDHEGDEQDLVLKVRHPKAGQERADVLRWGRAFEKALAKWQVKLRWEQSYADTWGRASDAERRGRFTDPDGQTKYAVLIGDHLDIYADLASVDAGHAPEQSISLEEASEIVRIGMQADAAVGASIGVAPGAEASILRVAMSKKWARSLRRQLRRIGRSANKRSVNEEATTRMRFLSTLLHEGTTEESPESFDEPSVEAVCEGVVRLEGSLASSACRLYRDRLEIKTGDSVLEISVGDMEEITHSQNGRMVITHSAGNTAFDVDAGQPAQLEAWVEALQSVRGVASGGPQPPIAPPARCPHVLDPLLEQVLREIFDECQSEAGYITMASFFSKCATSPLIQGFFAIDADLEAGIEEMRATLLEVSRELGSGSSRMGGPHGLDRIHWEEFKCFCHKWQGLRQPRSPPALPLRAASAEDVARVARPAIAPPALPLHRGCLRLIEWPGGLTDEAEWDLEHLRFDPTTGVATPLSDLRFVRTRFAGTESRPLVELERREQALAAFEELVTVHRLFQSAITIVLPPLVGGEGTPREHASRSQQVHSAKAEVLRSTLERLGVPSTLLRVREDPPHVARGSAPFFELDVRTRVWHFSIFCDRIECHNTEGDWLDGVKCDGLLGAQDMVDVRRSGDGFRIRAKGGTARLRLLPGDDLHFWMQALRASVRETSDPSISSNPAQVEWEPTPEFLEECQSHRVQHWLSSRTDPVICSGLIGLPARNSRGLAPRFAVLTHESLEYWSDVLDAAAGDPPEASVSVPDIRGVQASSAGVELKTPSGTTLLRTRNREELHRWNRAMLSAIAPADGATPEMTRVPTTRSSTFTAGAMSAKSSAVKVLRALSRKRSARSLERSIVDAPPPERYRQPTPRISSRSPRGVVLNTHRDARQAKELTLGAAEALVLLSSEDPAVAAKVVARDLRYSLPRGPPEPHEKITGSARVVAQRPPPGDLDWQKVTQRGPPPAPAALPSPKSTEADHAQRTRRVVRRSSRR